MNKYEKELIKMGFPLPPAKASAKEIMDFAKHGKVTKDISGALKGVRKFLVERSGKSNAKKKASSKSRP
jgi:hypothetical protein